MISLKLCFVIETGTDVRLVEGLAERFDLTLIYRQDQRHVISQPTLVPFNPVIGAASRSKFAVFVWNYLLQNRSVFDYIIVQNYGLAAIATNLAARITGIPTAMLVCSPLEAYYTCRTQHALLDKPFRRHELLGIQTIAYFNAILGQQYLTLSQYLTETIHQYGIKKPVSIIPLYGVDTTLFCPPNQLKIEIKAQLGLPTTGTMIFFSSRIAPEKDSETLLIAMRRLLDKDQDLWLLHRSGGYQTFLKDAERYRVNHRVIATDAVHPHKELPLDYQACDLCIQSSCQEGLGFSPLEALACGTPVIASAIGGLRETIIDGYTGWTYPVGDSTKLAECIKEVIDNPDKAGERAISGRKMVKEKYDRQQVFSKLFEMVRSTKRDGC